VRFAGPEGVGLGAGVGMAAGEGDGWEGAGWGVRGREIGWKTESRMWRVHDDQTSGQEP